jgi:hypothetical protein
MRDKEEGVGIFAQTAVTALAAALTMSGCSGGSAEQQKEEAHQRVASVERVEGSSVARVTLSASAAKRLGIRTATVEARKVKGRPRSLELPYTAVLYDQEGRTWTYTNPLELEFVRVPIRIERILGKIVLLANGPRPGTRVVTVGGAELLGTEYGVGEE